MPEERALIGAKEICKYLRWSKWKLYKHMPNMLQSRAVLKQTFGKPPNRHVNLYTFPSLLQRYLIDKSS
jgi:hypothetical protein